MRALRQTIPGAGECILQNMKIKLVQTKRSKMFVFATVHDVFTNNTKFSGISRELEWLKVVYIVQCSRQ